MKNLPKFDAESMATSKYYKGGFDQKMNKREAALILGVSPTASKNKVFCSNISFGERGDYNVRIFRLKTLIRKSCC